MPRAEQDIGETVLLFPRQAGSRRWEREKRSDPADLSVGPAPMGTGGFAKSMKELPNEGAHNMPD